VPGAIEEEGTAPSRNPAVGGVEEAPKRFVDSSAPHRESGFPLRTCTADTRYRTDAAPPMRRPDRRWPLQPCRRVAHWRPRSLHRPPRFRRRPRSPRQVRLPWPFRRLPRPPCSDWRSLEPTNRSAAPPIVCRSHRRSGIVQRVSREAAAPSRLGPWEGLRIRQRLAPLENKKQRGDECGASLQTLLPVGWVRRRNNLHPAIRALFDIRVVALWILAVIPVVLLLGLRGRLDKHRRRLLDDDWRRRIERIRSAPPPRPPSQPRTRSPPPPPPRPDPNTPANIITRPASISRQGAHEEQCYRGKDNTDALFHPHPLSREANVRFNGTPAASNGQSSRNRIGARRTNSHHSGRLSSNLLRTIRRTLSPFYSISTVRWAEMFQSLFRKNHPRSSSSCLLRLRNKAWSRGSAHS
jgi:hypothetical protein